LRIISGQARGRKLFTPSRESNAIRPTSDRAREALFSILGEKLITARVLDLYAGTGALGIEALSRGSRQVTFVDNNRKALDLIHKNCGICLQGLAMQEHKKAIIINHNLSRGLNFPDNTVLEDIPFDIVFLDPPYKKGLASRSLIDLSNSDHLRSGTLVIAEEFSGEILADSFGKLTLYDQRRYGETGLWFYTSEMS